MDLIGLLKTFVRMSERGSYSAVARELGVGQPAVSKQISTLEDHFGAPLLRRVSKRYVLTDAGEALYSYAQSTIQAHEAINLQIRNNGPSQRGSIRVALPTTLARRYVIPHLAGFLARHSDLDIELIAADQVTSLIESGVDLAIETAPVATTTLRTKRIARTRLVTVVAPALAAAIGQVKTAADLPGLPAVAFSEHGHSKAWTFASHSRKVEIRPKPRLLTNDADQMRIAALAGIGVAQGPLWLFEGDIESGDLVRLLPHLELPKSILAYWLERSRSQPRVRLFLEFLNQVLPAAKQLEKDSEIRKKMRLVL
jgi:LysR family transcriptional regulator for bpeEF and oprC